MALPTLMLLVSWIESSKKTAGCQSDFFTNIFCCQSGQCDILEANKSVVNKFSNVMLNLIQHLGESDTVSTRSRIKSGMTQTLYV